MQQQRRQSTPPMTPPRVAFDPPLFLQRRTAVYDLLVQLHGLERFNGKIKSLLDVGCGSEGLLMGSLIAPNDSLPLEQITGIDVDDALWDQHLVESLGPYGPHVGDYGRWRRLGVSLLHGSFEGLNLDILSHHDVIVSAEVIEHLDPEPLANYAPVLLGKLKPRVCIVTTPNRDFNDLFNLPFTPQSDTPDEEKSDPLELGQIVDPDSLEPPPLPPRTTKEDPHQEAWRSLAPGDVCSSGDRYWRHGVPYGMRHPDHRFEWTRREFREWANSAAEEFGYDVTFTGVGGLGNGMCVVGSTGWAVSAALAKACGYESTPANDYIKDNGVLSKAEEVWGDCSQIAVFTIREDEEEDLDSILKPEQKAKSDYPSTLSPFSLEHSLSSIREVVHHDFPYDPDEIFPPTYLTVIELLEKQMYTHLPSLVLAQWSKTPQQLARDRARQTESTMDSGLFDSDSECDYFWNPDLDGDETARKVRRKERRYEKTIQREIEEAVLQKRRVDLIRVVKITGAELQSLWDGGEGGNGGLRRLCRFRPEVFRNVLMEGWRATLQAHGRYIGDKAQGGHCQTIIDTTGTYQGEGDFDGDYDPASRRRKMSFTHDATSPTTPQGKLKQANLTSHIFTSFMYDSTPFTSTTGLVEVGSTSAGSRKRAISTPPSPSDSFSQAQDSEHALNTTRMPLYRSISDAPSRPSSPTLLHKQPELPLPIQMKSETKMVVKMYCAAASRSVIDLIRRDLSDVDREALKRWKVVKVEYNPRSALEAEAVAKKEDVNAIKEEEDEERPGTSSVEGTDWEQVKKERALETIERWENDLPAIITDSVGLGGEDGGVNNDGEWGTVDDTWKSTNATIAEEEDVNGNGNGQTPSQRDFLLEAVDEESDYSVHRGDVDFVVDGEDPWQEDSPISPLPKLQAELVYSLDHIDTSLSIDGQGKKTAGIAGMGVRVGGPGGSGAVGAGTSAENDLTPFMMANKTLESKDQGVLVVDWPEYLRKREGVAKWMAERKKAVMVWNGTCVAAGMGRDGVLGEVEWKAQERVLVGWEEWLEMERRNEEMGGGTVTGGEGGSGGGSAADSALKDLKVGIVLYRPKGLEDEGDEEGRVRNKDGFGSVAGFGGSSTEGPLSPFGEGRTGPIGGGVGVGGGEDMMMNGGMGRRMSRIAIDDGPPPPPPQQVVGSGVVELGLGAGSVVGGGGRSLATFPGQLTFEGWNGFGA